MKIVCPQCDGTGLIRIERDRLSFTKRCPYCAGWGKLTPITFDSKTAAANDSR